MTIGAGGEPRQCSGEAVTSERACRDHCAVMRKATKKKGIRCSQDAIAGVVFQPAVTVSGALARMPWSENTSLKVVRQEEIGVRRTSHFLDDPNDLMSRPS